MLPASVTSTFQGTAQAFEKSTRNLWLLLVVAILVVYIVLGILYEDFIHPVTILSGLPAASFGALATLYAAQTKLLYLADATPGIDRRLSRIRPLSA